MVTTLRDPSPRKMRGYTPLETSTIQENTLMILLRKFLMIIDRVLIRVAQTLTSMPLDVEHLEYLQLDGVEMPGLWVENSNHIASQLAFLGPSFVNAAD